MRWRIIKQTVLYSQLIIIKMSYKKKINLVNYFLRSSPANRYLSFVKILSIDVKKEPSPVIKSNEDYVQQFLNYLQASPPSSANLSTIKSRSAKFHPQLRKIFPSILAAKANTPGVWQQPKQLIESIKQVSAQSGEGITSFQELQQRLSIASPDNIAKARTYLIYLFKILINKRDKIHPQSLELDANLQLSQSIITALSRCQSSQKIQKNLKQLQAMQKLLRARQYHKKGLTEIALNNFQQICRDQAVSSQTRLEALKILCSTGEQLGDTSLLQSLISEMQAFGEKECEETIMSSLRRIKQTKS